MTTDELTVEARARIIWGEEPASVRYFLTSNGMSPDDADSRVQEFVTERVEEIRRTGVRHTCIGATILALCGGFIYYELKHPSRLFPAAQGKAMFFAGLAALYGIWRLVRGLSYLLSPKSETRSITEV